MVPHLFHKLQLLRAFFKIQILYQSSSPSGFYNITTCGDTWKTYCNMGRIPGCGEGGWTLVMRINGSKVCYKFNSRLDVLSACRAFWQNNWLKQFQVEFNKTKTKVITTANRSEGCNIISQWEFKVKTNKLLETRENARDQTILAKVLNVIGWDTSASFLDQSLSEVKNGFLPTLK